MKTLDRSTRGRPIAALPFTVALAVLIMTAAAGARAEDRCTPSTDKEKPLLCVAAAVTPPAVSANSQGLIEQNEGKKNKVTWETSDGAPFKITPKPGSEHVMTLTPSSPGFAPRWEGEANLPKAKFNYSIESATGTLDPDIIIEPGTSPGGDEKHHHSKGKHHRRSKKE
jgi:hypothetical protein